MFHLIAECSRRRKWTAARGDRSSWSLSVGLRFSLAAGRVIELRASPLGSSSLIAAGPTWAQRAGQAPSGSNCSSSDMLLATIN